MVALRAKGHVGSIHTCKDRNPKKSLLAFFWGYFPGQDLGVPLRHFRSNPKKLTPISYMQHGGGAKLGCHGRGGHRCRWLRGLGGDLFEPVSRYRLGFPTYVSQYQIIGGGPYSVWRGAYLRELPYRSPRPKRTDTCREKDRFWGTFLTQKSDQFRRRGLQKGLS